MIRETPTCLLRDGLDRKSNTRGKCSALPVPFTTRPGLDGSLEGIHSVWREPWEPPTWLVPAVYP